VRSDPETVLIARTDALAVEGVESAIERATAYAEAGADVVFVDAPRSTEELELLAGRIDAPLMANMTEGGRTPLLTAQELAELGYRLVIFPTTQTWLYAHAYRALCDEVVRTGTTRHLLDRLVTFDALNELVGRDLWEEQTASAWAPPGRR
jgi:2-methylisocitrate lyase-like PEP mutase family enzyme